MKNDRKRTAKSKNDSFPETNHKPLRTIRNPTDSTNVPLKGAPVSEMIRAVHRLDHINGVMPFVIARTVGVALLIVRIGAVLP